MGRLPDRGGYAYEPKWDGFRALIRCRDEFRVRSRRGWNMAARVPELVALPVDAVLDGELVALGADGWPYFPLVCQRLLNGDERIPLTYVVFDLLELEGRPTTHCRTLRGAGLLESLELTGPHWQTSPSSEDGEALFTVICERGLEGVVAKRLSGMYRMGERGWVKINQEPRLLAVSARAGGGDPRPLLSRWRSFLSGGSARDSRKTLRIICS